MLASAALQHFSPRPATGRDANDCRISGVRSRSLRWARQGPALGAQAGEGRLRQVLVERGGFARFRRATETPFNIVLEARP